MWYLLEYAALTDDSPSMEHVLHIPFHSPASSYSNIISKYQQLEET